MANDEPSFPGSEPSRWTAVIPANDGDDAETDATATGQDEHFRASTSSYYYP